MIVQCDMCFDLHDLKEWNEKDIFICKKCAEILSKIRKMEIKTGHNFDDRFKLALFDNLREAYKEENKVK